MKRFTKRIGGDCDYVAKGILADIEDVLESIPDESNELADKLKNTIEKVGTP